MTTLSKGHQNDVYWLAQALYLSKQYHRAAHLIRSRNLHLTNIQCCYLAAASLREAKEYSEAMEMLHESCSEPLENSKVFLNNSSQLESNFGVSVIEDLSMYGGNTVSIIKKN